MKKYCSLSKAYWVDRSNKVSMDKLIGIFGFLLWCIIIVCFYGFDFLIAVTYIFIEVVNIIDYKAF